MKIHTFSHAQTLPIEPEIAWAFFANTANLLQLTPPWIPMVNESLECPKAIYPGLIQVYGLQLFGFLPCRWVSEITHVDAPNYFIDEQKAGPFAFWHHEHRLVPVAEGVEVKDLVHYALPVGVFGSFAHELFVKSQIRQLFSHRARMLDEFFGSA